MTSDLTPRQWWLLTLINERAGELHVRAHRTTTGAASIAETGDGVSYPATIHPLVTAGLVELGDLTDLPDPAWDRWEAIQRARIVYRKKRRVWAEAHPDVVAEHAAGDGWKYMYATTTPAGFEPALPATPDHHRRGRPLTLTATGRALIERKETSR